MKSLKHTTKRRTSRTGILLCTLLLIFFTVTTQQCSGPEEIIEIPEETGKKDPPNEEKPGNNDQEGNEPGDNEPKENTSVDKTGGTVYKDGLTLTIPADAFTSPVTMEITPQADGIVMEEYEASPYYMIKLPRNFAKPIQLQLPTDSEITQGEVYFRITTAGLEVSSQQESSSAMWIKGVKEVDYYTATLNPLEETSDEQVELIVGLVKDYQASNESESRAITSERKCVVYAPRFYHEESKEIAHHVEEAIKRLEAVGFSFEQRNRQIQVEVKKLGELAYGYFVSSIFGGEYNSLEINSQKLSEKEEIKRTIMHEMTHFSQYYYDPRPVFKKSTSIFKNEFLWMEEAVAAWTENLYVEGISSVILGNQFCPLEGFFPLEGEEEDNHGYGMSRLVSWIANRYGDNNKIVELHKQQLKGATSVYDAFNKAFPDLFMEYGIFLQDYVRDNGVKNLIQGMTRDKLFLNSMKEVKTKAPPQCRPYSVRYERISIDPDFELPDNGNEVSLVINVEGGVDGGKGQYCEIYRNNNDTKAITFVDEFHDSYRFENAAELQKSKDMLYVVYYHPFNSESEVIMKAQLHKQVEFGGAIVQLKINRWNEEEGYYSIEERTFPDGHGVPTATSKTTGSTVIDGKKILFTSSGSYSDFYESEWEINLELDEGGQKIVNGTAQSVTRYLSQGELDSSVTTTSISFHDIPFKVIQSYDGAYIFGASQTGANGKYLTSFSYKYEHVKWDGELEVIEWTSASNEPTTKYDLVISLHPK